MTSLGLGKDISPLEITNISRHGIWLILHDKEYYLPYEKYPWFRNARISEIIDVELLHGFHLYWPELDIDLEIASLEDPSQFPLIDTQTRSD